MSAVADYDPAAVLDLAGARSHAACGPEEAIHAIARVAYDHLGDRQAHLAAGAVNEGESQFFVSGAFFVTPDGRFQMLVGNTGFPPEQKRLIIPIDGGNPGQVIRTRKPLLLANTDERTDFRQYLKTARMKSAVYAPLLWRDGIMGLLIVAANARYTMGEKDLSTLSALSRLAAATWIAFNGPAWLDSAYPP
jgi:hypothetical protein